MNACKSRAGRLRLGTSAEFSILEIQLSPFFFAIFSKKYLQKTEMLQIYMLIVKDSMIDVVKNVFNLILKYFIDEISKGSV